MFKLARTASCIRRTLRPEVLRLVFRVQTPTPSRRFLSASSSRAHSDPQLGLETGSSPNENSGSISEPPRPPLADIPDPVSGWPTPWMTEEHFSIYINGLYDLGWGIHFSAANSKFARPLPTSKGKERSVDDAPEQVICRVPELLKTYNFSSWASALAFVNDLTALMEKEKHHCALHITDRENPQVTVYVHTHTACPPKWEDMAVDVTNAPGITLRDIRFAILTDRLHEEQYITKDLGRRSTLRVKSQVLEWKEYERRLKANLSGPHAQRTANDSNPLGYPDDIAIQYRASLTAKTPASLQKARSTRTRRSIACPACGRPHPLELCLSRHSMPPSKPCLRCGGSHWKIDCPHKDTKRRKLSSLRPPPGVTCNKCGGNHTISDCHLRDPPTKPCPNCGGDHWKIDCRVPQVSHERAMKFALPIP